MPDSLAALVLGAGGGTRLRPLTSVVPKVLCPVGGVPLLDRAVAQVSAVVGADAVAVNAHHGAEQVVAHVGAAAHVSVEEGEALGTAGAVAALRPWLAGRAVLVVNGDTWHEADLGVLLDGWDGTRARVLVAGREPSLAGRPRVVGSVLPPAAVAELPLTPSGLWEVCWRQRLEEGRLDVLAADVRFVACDRPRDYLAANLLASGGEPVVGAGAEIGDALESGRLVRSVLWSGAVVRPGEVLVDAIRTATGMTVLVR